VHWTLITRRLAADLDRLCFGRLLLRKAKAKPMLSKLMFAAMIETESSMTNGSSLLQSTFNQWLAKVWMAFMDGSQQYGSY
jgi:hypothetical protein